MPDPGADVYILDESLAGADPTSTDTMYLLSTAGPTTPTTFYAPDSGDATLDAQLSAYFTEGGRSVVVQGVGDGTTLPEGADAVAMLPEGPGQLIAPELVTSAELIPVIEAAWPGKVVLANGAAGLTDTQLGALASSIIAGCDARGAALFADVAQYPSSNGAGTVNVPWPITVAGMIAYRDILTGNPGDAAAGLDGTSHASGLSAERTSAARDALKAAQVNTAKTVQGTIRNYGIRSLADLVAHPMWWNFWGSRVVMAFRSRALAVAEDFVFGQIDPQSKLIERFGARLAAEAKALYDLGALYGNSPADAYSIDVGPTVNTVATIEAGELKARARLKVSENAEHVSIDLIRRAIDATV